MQKTSKMGLSKALKPGVRLVVLHVCCSALLSGDSSISARGKCMQHKFIKEHRIFRTEQCFITIKYGLSILPIYKRGNNF